MVRLRFVIRSGALVLRISEGKERYYKKVHSLLIGNPDINIGIPTKKNLTVVVLHTLRTTHSSRDLKKFTRYL